VAKRLVSPESISSEQVAGPIIILGTEGVTVQFAKCCYPIPEDAIVGMIKKDYGLVIHTYDCTNITNGAKNSENYLDVTWGKDIARIFEVGIKITVVNKQGVLARVAAEIARAESNINDIAMDSEEDYTQMRFILQVNNRQHLAQIIRGLRQVKEVARISRIRG
jgi:GTP pyrophosphokinase